MENESPMQTQCDVCAFKLTENQSTNANARLIESKYRTIREVKNAPKKTRHVHVGGNDGGLEILLLEGALMLA